MERQQHGGHAVRHSPAFAEVLGAGPARQARPTRDALEVFYLCVMLGFRGEMAGKPVELNAWRDAVEAQIMHGDDRAYTPPPGLKLTPNVPELKGASVMQQRFLLVTVLALLFIPLVVVLITRS